MNHQAAINAAQALLNAHIKALNAKDEAALAQTLHFPHFRLSGTELKVWETPESYFSDFRKRAGDAWSHSRFVEVVPIQASDSKVHFQVTVERFDAGGQPIASFDSLWVTTKENHRWAAKMRSSFASL